MTWTDNIFGGDRVKVYIRDSEETVTFTVREAHYPWGRTMGKYLVAPSGQIYWEDDAMANVIEHALIPWEPGVTIRARIEPFIDFSEEHTELAEDGTFLDSLKGYHTLGPERRKPNQWRTTIETSSGASVIWDVDLSDIIQWRFLTITDRVVMYLTEEAACRAAEGKLMPPHDIEDTIPNRVKFALIPMLGGRREGAKFDPYF